MFKLQWKHGYKQWPNKVLHCNSSSLQLCLVLVQLLIHARNLPVLVSAGGFKDFSRDFFWKPLENRKTVCMRASQLFCLLVTSKKSSGLYGFIRLVVLFVCLFLFSKVILTPLKKTHPETILTVRASTNLFSIRLATYSFPNLSLTIKKMASHLPPSRSPHM